MTAFILFPPLLGCMSEGTGFSALLALPLAIGADVEISGDEPMPLGAFLLLVCSHAR